MGKEILYRHKFLLSVISEAGGYLNKTDCQKIIFLVCQHSNNYYDFFPYKYGGFSHVLYEDKRVLTNVGLLYDEDGFRVKKNSQHLLKKADIEVIRAVFAELNGLKGKRLVRKLYLEYPYFAHRSEILSITLKAPEVLRVKKTLPAQIDRKLFTIGYEGMSIDAFLNKLIENNINALIDVRKNPLSRKFGFSIHQLRKYVEANGINYYHLPELGIASELRRDLKSPDSYSALFSYYSNNILKANDGVEEIKKLSAKHSRLALTCFEADPNYCHRHVITNHLETLADFNIPISHLY